jgi:hypothetical protein
MFHAKHITLAVPVLFLMTGCVPKPVEPPQPEKVCCRFIIGGDIMTEDLLTKEECLKQDHGEVIEVDPGRDTPHPCCPNATGPTCGDADR